jgi:hypothetical protein
MQQVLFSARENKSCVLEAHDIVRSVLPLEEYKKVLDDFAANVLKRITEFFL